MGNSHSHHGGVVAEPRAHNSHSSHERKGHTVSLHLPHLKKSSPPSSSAASTPKHSHTSLPNGSAQKQPDSLGKTKSVGHLMHNMSNKTAPEDKTPQATRAPSLQPNEKGHVQRSSSSGSLKLPTHGSSFHLPHVKFPSFHGHHEHSTSCQVMEELANEPGFKYALDQFEIIKQIGSGAFGRVLLCKHTLTGQKVVLKAIEKKLVVRMKQQQHLREERNVLKELSEHNCPFVVKTVGCFQDASTVYFVMEYVPGGELFAHLQASNHHHFSEKRARFYLSEAILALQHMHEKERVVYRDIKPENMLLDEHGHLKIVDFGFAKHLDDEERTYTFCGTPDYLAPEVIKGKGCSREADYWALGVLTYELLVGHAPFETREAHSGKVTYKHILGGRVQFPKFVSKEAREFIQALLQVDPTKRLGHTGGVEAIKHHPWFTATDWEAILRMEVKPPKLHKCKKGTVNLQAPQDPRQVKAEPVLDEETKALFSSFDFVTRPESHMEQIQEEEQPGPAQAQPERQAPAVAGGVVPNGIRNKRFYIAGEEGEEEEDSK